MDSLVLNAFTYTIPSSKAPRDPKTSKFEPESAQPHPNNKNINSHISESHMKFSARVSVGPTIASPVKLKAISTTMQESPVDVVMTPELPLPITNSQGPNSNKTKSALNNNNNSNNPNRNHARAKDKKKSKRRSSKF